MKIDSKMKRWLGELSRLIVGATFLFSGFVKAVDPIGFVYKIQDYLLALHLDFLFVLAKPTAVVMVVAELLIGLFLLLGIWRRWSSVLAALFMTFFLPLTLWIALKNPVEDCGCFGDAWVISNWQTFYKNIVLTAGAFYLLFNYKYIRPWFKGRKEHGIAIYMVLLGFSFAIYNMVRLPLIDFRPYKIGANIAEKAIVDPSKGDITENIFIYSKDGVEQEFDEANYPWGDPAWEFVNITTRVIEEGEQPEIEDFHLVAYDYDVEMGFYADEDITEQVLSDQGYSFLMVSCFLEQMKSKDVQRFANIAQKVEASGMNFYLLTASAEDLFQSLSDEIGYQFNFVQADELLLKTIVRTNPGVVLLKDGVVMNKWDGRSFPAVIDTNSMELYEAVGKNPSRGAKGLTVFALLFVAPLLVVRLKKNK